MAHEQYIEHVLSSLSEKSKKDLQTHLNRLDCILEQIEKVQSPEKESLLVHLILYPYDQPIESEQFHSSL